MAATNTQRIAVKRVREPRTDGETRLLVDRLWPRGVSKAVADLDGWPKDITPSTDLRKEYHHEGMSFEEFTQRYRHELHENPDLDAFVSTIADALKPSGHTVSFLIASDPTKNNHADVLKEVVIEKLAGEQR